MQTLGISERRKSPTEYSISGLSTTILAILIKEKQQKISTTNS